MPMRTCLLLVATLALGACGEDDAPSTLYNRMGGEPGVRAVVDDIVTAVSADEKINGYFRNTSVDMGRMADCMVKQIGAATGGPQTYPDAGCRAMQQAHAGMGVSNNDFDDFATAAMTAVNATSLSAVDKSELLAMFSGHRGDIVEDPENNATVYQRVGRKPAIASVAADFEAAVAADPAINGFFAGIQDITRLHSCLTRQICSIDGPCIYGEETAEEFPGLSIQTGCRPMPAAHYGLHSGTPTNTITVDHFNAIVGHLATALTNAGVSQADIGAIAGVLGPLCSQIVADPLTCP